MNYQACCIELLDIANLMLVVPHNYDFGFGRDDWSHFFFLLRTFLVFDNGTISSVYREIFTCSV